MTITATIRIVTFFSSNVTKASLHPCTNIINLSKKRLNKLNNQIKGNKKVKNINGDVDAVIINYINIYMSALYWQFIIIIVKGHIIKRSHNIHRERQNERMGKGLYSMPPKHEPEF